MNAEFEIKVKIDQNGVSTNISTKEMKDLDINLFGQVLKVFADVQKKVSAQVEKFVGAEGAESEEKGDETQPDNKQEVVNHDDTGSAY